MKKLNVLQGQWQSAIRAELPNAKGDPMRAASLAARKNPGLRARMVAAANKRTKAVDEDELPEDEELEDEDVLDDEELTEDEELAPSTRRKSKKAAKPTAKKASKSAWDLEAARIAAKHGFA
jgi:hypothetical protein